jgi:hypothetical protein
MEEVSLWFRVSLGFRVLSWSFRSGGEISDLSENGRIDDENEP